MRILACLLVVTTALKPPDRRPRAALKSLRSTAIPIHPARQRAAVPPERAAVPPPEAILPPSLLSKPETGSLDDAGPLYLSLSALFSKISARLKQAGPAPYDEATIEDVQRLLGRAELNPTEWEGFAALAANRYTRNVVAVDDRFVALLLCWDADQASSVHDHAGSSCWVKLLRGQLEEQKYAPTYERGEWTAVGAVERVDEGAATYMDDDRGLHRISNPSASTPAVSLHVYAPGFEECNLFKDDGVVARGSMVSAMAPERPPDAPGLPDRVSLERLGAELENLAFADPRAEDAAVSSLLARLALTPEEWREYCSGPCFSEHGYARHLAHCSDKYSVVVSCWLPNQATGAHVQGEDRAAWTKMLHGSIEYAFPDEGAEGVAALFVVAADQPFHEEPWMRTARRVARNPTDGVAVSLHVTSPPMTSFEDLQGRKRDAVRHEAVPGLAAAVRGNNLYTSLSGLAALVGEAFAAPGDPVEPVTHLLQNVQLNRREWRTYGAWDSDQFSRVLLAEAPAFNMFLVAWERGNYSPVHDHAGSASWTKVLEGTLDEAMYGMGPDGLRLARAGPQGEGSVTYANDDLVHGCVAATRCFTLSLYSPPYTVANAFVDDGSSTVRVEIPTHVRGDRATAPNLRPPESKVLDLSAGEDPSRDPRTRWKLDSQHPHASGAARPLGPEDVSYG
mmetsp:Transcript_36673/g.113491  ORF Transcript_36673/g.113491 Transcript_36673/m.113491 type:complete len:679 (-) Transcript_36673:19-2055(-)